MSMPSLPVSTIFFDMDNTLFDLVEAQVASCREVVRFLGHDDGEELFSYFLRPVHGFESHENIRQYMEERTIPVDGTFKKACRIYETEKLRHISPYPGVAETLRQLHERGYPMCIVTDAHSRDATLRLEKIDLLPFFTGMIAYDLVQVKKPAPGPFLAALEMMRASPDNTLLVGDSIRRDIEPCARLGIRTVYARYGDRFADGRRDPGADFIIDGLDELPVIIDQINRS
ncbi:MAG: HAD family hydrolase [Methanoregula sp.]|uniref:HAD family hydrolase n=1 Tax=Methanoregula sp. TaxID=2052170 RepID=UPI0025D7513F|nr:HAD family hydrolase [Methanoregula sp.]MCK9630972.1 HAD family hydrolase [Methanoregula sp.]